MTELDKIARARMYLEKLANGINPLTDVEVSPNDIVNNVRISRCMFYVSDILRQIIENKGKFKVEMPEQIPFTITPQQLAKYEFSDTAIQISEIVRRINSLIDTVYVKSLKTTAITNFLVQINMLAVEESAKGKAVKRPTQQGRELGITTEQRLGKYGEYTAVIYNREAQNFILDNIDAIIAINNEKKPSKPKGEPWNVIDDEFLRDLTAKNISVEKIAESFKRTSDEIYDRQKVLGLL